MNQTLAYGHTHINVQVPDTIMGTCLDIPTEQSQDEKLLVQQALATADVPLEDFITGVSRVAIIISDYTRPTGTQIYVPIIIEKLLSLGITENQITIIIALGLHRPATQTEITDLVGPAVQRTIRIENHQAQQNIEFVGDVGFNATAMHADLIILTGVVTFHPMAGFSGGYKSLLPGVADKESILTNHRLFFSGNRKHPSVNPNSTQDNPVLQHIIGSCEHIPKPIFCLNVVLNQEKRIRYASAGSVRNAWNNCCMNVRSFNSVGIEHTYPFVLASSGGSPSDFSFYQCMKVLTHAAAACTEGGSMIILAECGHGWEIHPDLIPWFSLPLEQVAHLLTQDFRMDGLAVYMAMRIIRNHTVYLLSSLPAGEVRQTGMIPIANETVLQDLLTTTVRDELIMLPHGAQSLPICTRP